ncbi:GNAT family N-acetyltransferase [Pseudanabaena sp. FACHB-2040]|uniref:GNAT family N-acetyltransferase n=1 Tax=Pseudanabaena sp. FACHB-2040 TaxID=2692859 RepID=UPI0016894435|nr:GNAT family N-acetyltransferase [Pseudanabaena sp. FACHB-2040]MBD2258490.1 GNAT family N-acetyltransferase [Pseudanabaena sp. FACHB-2040]
MSLTLETERLRLRPIADSEVDTLHAILTDSFVRKYLCDDQIFSRQQVEEMLAESQRAFAEERWGLWLIEVKAEPTPIGFVGLWNFFEEPQPQLAYALLPGATGQGYATEAATRILTYAFDELGYGYLVASCDKPNLASQNVAERIGMKRVEERTENGKPIVFFRIERSMGEDGSEG